MPIVLRLLKYLKPHSAQALLGLVAMLGAQIANAAVPWLLRRAIDDVILPARFDLLRPLATLMVSVAVFRALALFVQRFSMEAVAQKVIYDLRNQLYDHLQSLSFGFFDNAQTGQLMSRVTTDVETVRRLLGFGFVNLLSNSFTLVLTVGLCLRLDWRLTLFSLSTLPFLLYVVRAFSTRVRPAYLAIQEQVAEMTSVLQENITGVRVVRAFAQEEAEQARFGEVNTGFFDRQLYAIRMWAKYFPMMNFITAAGTAIVLWYGGYEVISGRMSIGSLVAFNSYLLSLMGPLRMIGWIANLFQRAIASGQRVFEIFDTSQQIAEKPDAIDPGVLKGHVRFENVTFAYEGELERAVLKNLDLDVKPGQTIALLGGTGSGKSTVISLIPRFYDVTQGRITIDGHDSRDLRLSGLRRQVGIVLQETFLFSASIRENIAYGSPHASLEDVQRVAKAARIHDFIMTLENEYDTVVGERGVGLSGGQKQRVAIARALLTDPAILILDDSMSSVDTETEYQIQQALDELLRGRTTFVIAQRLSTVKTADQIVVLEDGVVVERGTHESLLEASGFYKEIYAMQFSWQEGGDS